MPSGVGAQNLKMQYDIFHRIDRPGYDSWIGAEYIPARHTSDMLGWLENYL